MKICHICNNTANDEATFCSNCGTHLPEGCSVYQPKDIKEPISVGGWIGRSLIPYIPILGGLIYLIMLFVWSGSKTKEETFRNWAKAQLILLAVFLALGIIAMVLGLTVFSDVLSNL